MTKRILFSLAIILIAQYAVQAQKIAISKGQKLETVLTTAMTMDVMGQSIENQTTVTSTAEVKEVNSNGSLFTNTIKRMLVKGSAMGQEINFDSDKKEDMSGQMGQVLSGKIGTPQEVLVNNNGKVIELKDTVKKAPGGMNDMMSMSGDLVKGQAYPLLIQLPTKSVKPGDTWTDSIGSAATVKSVTTYTLKGITPEGVQVSFTGTVAKSGTIEQNGMEIQMDIAGTVKGEATYETNTGLLVKNSSVTDITGTMTVMGQNAPIAMNMKATTVAKKL
jgi:hypothetical protein